MSFKDSAIFQSHPERARLVEEAKESRGLAIFGVILMALAGFVAYGCREEPTLTFIFSLASLAFFMLAMDALGKSSPDFSALEMSLPEIGQLLEGRSAEQICQMTKEDLCLAAESCLIKAALVVLTLEANLKKNAIPELVKSAQQLLEAARRRFKETYEELQAAGLVDDSGYGRYYEIAKRWFQATNN